MTTTRHDTVRSRLALRASPQRVFQAWARADDLGRWYLPGEGDWTSKIITHDFRIGGQKKLSFGPPGETYFEDCRYEDIVENERICFSMTIARGDQRITTSMVTVELFPHRHGVECVVTDQLVILDGGDTASDRERGWGETLAKLPAVVETPN